MAELEAPNQALARKRRKEILASQKSVKRQRIAESEVVKRDNSSSCEPVITTSSTRSTPESAGNQTKSISCKAKVIKSSTKYQNRYKPEVRMTIEEEAEWRKEARRQRNRTSAANSRNKVRNRITELESEVDEWKSKCTSLTKRLEILEKRMHPPPPQNQSLTHPVSPVTSGGVPSCISTCSEESFDVSPFLLDFSDCNLIFTETPTQQRQPIIQQPVTNDIDHHVIEITSRPAVSNHYL